MYLSLFAGSEYVFVGSLMKGMCRIVLTLICLLIASKAARSQASLRAKWEELTGPDFIEAIHQSRSVCVLPFGIIEKHGPHLPLGTDLLDVRFAVMNAVKQEYAVVFPEYYFGQIFEAKHQPGTLVCLPKTPSDLSKVPHASCNNVTCLHYEPRCSCRTWMLLILGPFARDDRFSVGTGS